MERRLNRLETLWQADATAIAEASWSIQWAIEYPWLDHDKAAWAARIRTTHGLDDDGLRRAIERALTRLGSSREDARHVAALGLEGLLATTLTDPASTALSEV
jgi:hypothetical protein